MAKTIYKLYLILWKNLTIRRRKPIRTLTEILWPLALFGILAALRTTTERYQNPECHYTAYAMPSAGLIPWLQSTICFMNFLDYWKLDPISFKKFLNFKNLFMHPVRNPELRPKNAVKWQNRVFLSQNRISKTWLKIISCRETTTKKR